MEKDWKQVFLSAQLYQAEIAKDLLENNGINAIIMNQKDSSYTSFGNIEVFVNEKDEEKALEILKELKH
jgi:hypothetical protein